MNEMRRDEAMWSESVLVSSACGEISARGRSHVETSKQKAHQGNQARSCNTRINTRRVGRVDICGTESLLAREARRATQS